MSDIFHGFTPQPTPPLTAHMRQHLITASRADLTRAEAQRAALPRDRRRRTETQAARFWHLTEKIERTRADLAMVEGR